MVQQAFSEFQPALHATGERFRSFLGAVSEADPLQHFLNASGQGNAAQPVKMSLMTQVLSRTQFNIDALRLEHNSNLSAQTAWIAGGVVAHDDSVSLRRQHQRGENTKKCGFPTP